MFRTDRPAGESPLAATCPPLDLEGAHGVVWDNKLHRLWAVGSTELVCCTYTGGSADPALAYEARIKLPGYGGGHDLFPVPGTRQLFVTGQQVWVFDTESRTFAEYDPRGNVKSVTQKEADGLVLFMAPTTSWWSDTISSPDGKIKKTLPGAQFYKMRWWVPNAFSYGEQGATGENAATTARRTSGSR